MKYIPFIFLFLYGFKSGFHIITQVLEGPVWGGILLGCFMGIACIKILQAIIPKPPKLIDPIHQGFLDQLDAEFSKIKEDYVRRKSD